METQEIIEKIINGVAVVTSKRGNKDINGLSVAWMSQVSWDPPLVMVAIGKVNYTHDFIKESKVFAISILSQNMKDMAKLFGLKSGRDINKFQDITYEFKKSGSPIISDCLAYLDCKVLKSFDVGDHTIFVGEILDTDIKDDKEPLIYNSKDYF